MTRHERITIGIAVEVLLEARRVAGKQKVDTVPVRLALRVLLPHCPERWPLTSFWDSAGQPQELNRSQGCGAALNGILRQLRSSGIRLDDSAERLEST